jgi:hypothetical protein
VTFWEWLTDDDAPLRLLGFALAVIAVCFGLTSIALWRMLS